MLSPLLLLSLLPAAPAAPAPLTASPVPAFATQDLKAEFEKRFAEAEGDVAKLWAVVDWCEANSLDKERRKCLRAILDLDDADKKAHELLGHVYYDGKWFTTEKKLEDYKKEEASRLAAEREKEAKAKGLVRFGDEWVDPDDLPYLQRGLVRAPDGSWADPLELQRKAEGWRLQDLTWISPEEFEKADAGLFKCGDQWLTLAEADAWHSELGQWWTLPTDYFHLYTTLPREFALSTVKPEIDRTVRDLVRIYGVPATTPLKVIVLSSVEQYSVFAGGAEGWDSTDARGYSSAHGAFFADGLIDGQNRKFNGAGACYWDPTSDAGNSYGKTFARHAAGQSFGEYVDPSAKTVTKFETAAQPQASIEKFLDEFYAEKKVPLWFRYGAAAYVERYFVDAFVAEGGDPYWARKWSVENIALKGGLDPLKTVFELPISAENPDSGKLINEAGLVVAFVVDGECAPVKAAHAALKDALKKREDPTQAFRKLEAEIEKHVDDLRKFANL